MQVAQQAHESYRRMLLVRGIFAILFGVVVLALSPRNSILFLVYVFGAYAFISGLVYGAMALRYTKEDGWALLLVEGIVGIVVGIAAFVWPGITAFVLLFLIAVWAIVTGILEMVAAFTLPEMGTKNEWLLGLAGLASVIFGVLVAIWPRQGLVAVVWLIGIYAIVVGILYLVRFFQTRSLATAS
jgi:uncharacterized membrane protein HdeD (DUF308 family)